MWLPVRLKCTKLILCPWVCESLNKTNSCKPNFCKQKNVESPLKINYAQSLHIFSGLFCQVMFGQKFWELYKFVSSYRIYLQFFVFYVITCFFFLVLFTRWKKKKGRSELSKVTTSFCGKKECPVGTKTHNKTTFFDFCFLMIKLEKVRFYAQHV